LKTKYTNKFNLVIDGETGESTIIFKFQDQVINTNGSVVGRNCNVITKVVMSIDQLEDLRSKISKSMRDYNSRHNGRGIIPE